MSAQGQDQHLPMPAAWDPALGALRPDAPVPEHPVALGPLADVVLAALGKEFGALLWAHWAGGTPLRQLAPAHSLTLGRLPTATRAATRRALACPAARRA